MVKDTRAKLWSTLERDVQGRGRAKDLRFVLRGPWKKFVRRQEGFLVFVVDGEYVRNNLSIMFGHGGHGFVHEFIPLREIWVSTHHFRGCGCRKRSVRQAMSQNAFDSTTIHEITEFQAMQRGARYWRAHHLALKKEREVGLLRNPYLDLS